MLVLFAPGAMAVEVTMLQVWLSQFRSANRTKARGPNN
jgi:hypothetical protein